MIIEIEAKSKKEAIKKTKQLYSDENFVLDYNHHIATDFILNNGISFVKDEKYLLLDEIIEYLFEDEKKHYEESRDKTNSIYKKLVRLKELNK